MNRPPGAYRCPECGAYDPAVDVATLTIEAARLAMVNAKGEYVAAHASARRARAWSLGAAIASAILAVIYVVLIVTT